VLTITCKYIQMCSKNFGSPIPLHSHITKYHTMQQFGKFVRAKSEKSIPVHFAKFRKISFFAVDFQSKHSKKDDSWQKKFNYEQTTEHFHRFNTEIFSSMEKSVKKPKLKKSSKKIALETGRSSKIKPETSVKPETANQIADERLVGCETSAKERKKRHLVAKARNSKRKQNRLLRDFLEKSAKKPGNVVVEVPEQGRKRLELNLAGGGQCYSWDAYRDQPWWWSSVFVGSCIFYSKKLTELSKSEQNFPTNLGCGKWKIGLICYSKMF